MIPVSIKKDIIDYAVILTNLLLTGATLAIAIYAVKQVQLGKAMFVSTFRPKLIIRGVGLIPGRYIEVAGEQQIEDDLVWQIQYLVANVGGTAAHITESNLTIAHIKDADLPTFPPYSRNRDSMGQFTVKPGENREGLVKIEQRGDAMRFRMLKVMREGGGNPSMDIFCFGFVQYRDDIGTTRRTAFCRRYDIETGGFNRVKNQDYEYAD